MFKNRIDAGEQLAKKLKQYQGQDTVVLALPRGGVIMGYVVAQVLKSPLDIVVTRKVGHPDNPEYAVCVVDEKGSLLCNEMEIRAIDPLWLQTEILYQKKEAQRRVALYQGKRESPEIKGKMAIIVDDGIATGFTMRLAVRAIKMQNPKKIIVAVPVAPAESLLALKDEGADEIIVLEPPEEFMGAVGSHYMEFEQVEDNEVINLLQKC